MSLIHVQWSSYEERLTEAVAFARRMIDRKDLNGLTVTGCMTTAAYSYRVSLSDVEAAVAADERLAA